MRKYRNLLINADSGNDLHTAKLFVDTFIDNHGISRILTEVHVYKGKIIYQEDGDYVAVIKNKDGIAVGYGYERLEDAKACIDELTKNLIFKTVTQKHSEQRYHLTIEPNTSITVECTYTNRKEPKPTSVSFKVGDMAEYGSYNLSFIGKIIGISSKTILFETGSQHQPEKRRLKLEEFCMRNWDFDLEAKRASNLDEMQYI